MCYVPSDQWKAVCARENIAQHGTCVCGVTVRQAQDTQTLRPVRACLLMTDRRVQDIQWPKRAVSRPKMPESFEPVQSPYVKNAVLD